MNLAAPLRRSAFQRLFAGQVVSDLGDWLDYVALIVLVVYTWDYGPGALAALAVCMAAPWALVAPISGVWADRLPRKPVMIGCDLARAAIVFGLVFAPNLYVLLALVAAKMSFSTLFVPAQQSSIRLTVPDDELLAASSLSQFSLQGTKIAGPALGGLVIAALSVRWAFAIDAMTFLVSAAILSFLPRLAAPVSEQVGGPPERNFRRELMEGLHVIGRDRGLALAIGAMASAVFLVFTFDALSPLALQELGMNPSRLGFAIGGIGFGAAAGTLLIGQLGQTFDPYVLLAAGKVMAGSAVALIGVGVATDVSVPAAVWVAVLFVMGFGAASILVPYSFLVQSRTPPELLGRVIVSADAIQMILALGAPPLGAFIASRVGIAPLFGVAGGALAVLGVLLLAARPAAEAVADTEGLADVVAHGFAVTAGAEAHYGLSSAARYSQPL